MAPRLILVSNRVNLPDGGSKQAGGLTVAVNAAMKNRVGVWFGWSGKVGEGAESPAPTVTERHHRTYITLDLSKTDFEEYYNGFANRVLWPVLHYRVDLEEFSSVDFSGYQRVNSRFADALSPFLTPDDVIWVHDYHLLPLAKELRARGRQNPIGFFLHIPCPPPDILKALPRHQETVGALSWCDLVGVQTEQDAENLGRYFVALGGTAARSPGVFDVEGRKTRVRTFPVAIATAVYARAARKSVKSTLVSDLRASLDGKSLIMGVDRLDYTKGIPDRIKAFGKFLEKYPEWHAKATLLQVTPKSRSGVPEYAAMQKEISGLVGHLNGQEGEANWTPVLYVNRSYSRAELAGFYRSAHVGLVTPLRDGMNLVAKEYVAAQDPNNPGALVLSQFAGAASELDGALIVNPHEPEGVADAIKQALEMPLEERVKRHQRMFARLETYDIARWAADFLAALGEAREQPGLLMSLRELFGAFA
jgi:trehalose 6-phosphate synthase